MISTNPMITNTTQGSAPCGAAMRGFFAFTGLNLATTR